MDSVPLFGGLHHARLVIYFHELFGVFDELEDATNGLVQDFGLELIWSLTIRELQDGRGSQLAF